MKKKYKLQGIHWHGWAWKVNGSEGFKDGQLFHWAEASKPKDKRPTEGGKWVRVKFVELRSSGQRTDDPRDSRND